MSTAPLGPTKLFVGPCDHWCYCQCPFDEGVRGGGDKESRASFLSENNWAHSLKQ